MDIELAENLLNEDVEDSVYDMYVEAQEETMVGKSRWSVHYEKVFQKKDDNTFWRVSWSRGATEYQDDGVENVYVEEVEKREVMVTKFVTKSKNG